MCQARNLWKFIVLLNILVMSPNLFYLSQNLVCCAADVLEGRGLVQVAITVAELMRFHTPRSPAHSLNA